MSSERENKGQSKLHTWTNAAGETQELSQAEGKARRQELKDSGITYEVRGYSEDYPIASNSTESGRKKNRRVEVSFPRGGN